MPGAGDGDAAGGRSELVATARHHVALLPDMDATLGALVADLARARRRIWVETYIYRDDRAGRALAACLAAAAARGVDVRVLYDASGSRGTDRAFFAALGRRGVAVRAFRPLRVALRTGRPWLRDHSRLVLCDEVGYTGGANVGDEWLPRALGGGGWHDVCARVVGPCVADMARSFEQRWAEATGAPGAPGDVATEAPGDADVEWVSDSPLGAHGVLARHRARVQRARRRVWLANAYCMPPAGLLRDLYAAAARGVDVRLIVPAHTDLPAIRRAARAEYDAWLAHGLAVYEYAPAVLHAKYGLIDDDWATVGTFNALSAAVRLAVESNLFVYEPRWVAEVAAAFVRDVARSAPVSRADLARRPLLARAVDALAHGFFALFEPAAAAPGRAPRGRPREITPRSSAGSCARSGSSRRRCGT